MGKNEVGPKSSSRDFRRARWGQGPAPGRAEMPAWLVGRAHGSSAPCSCTSAGDTGRGAAVPAKETGVSAAHGACT